jgi:uncharacterized protein YwqG
MPKRASIEFVEGSQTKSSELRFGGEPFGLPVKLWPKSKSTGNAMQFVCQIPFGPDLFPGTVESVAYIFLSQAEHAETWSPDAGENAVIIVPREKLTNSITVGDAPRLARMVKRFWNKNLTPQTCIYSARLQISEDPEFISENELFKLSEDEIRRYRKTLLENKLGGTPGFLQGDELPFPAPWHLLLQLDSANVPFWINFGDAGIGYAFIDGSGKTGKFLWQCC